MAINITAHQKYHMAVGFVPLHNNLVITGKKKEINKLFPEYIW
jgi:hypothetical protein